MILREIDGEKKVGRTYETGGTDITTRLNGTGHITFPQQVTQSEIRNENREERARQQRQKKLSLDDAGRKQDLKNLDEESFQ
jgi:hypothetical protein